jgi:hypothetical protein
MLFEGPDFDIGQPSVNSLQCRMKVGTSYRVYAASSVDCRSALSRLMTVWREWGGEGALSLLLFSNDDNLCHREWNVTCRFENLWYQNSKLICTIQQSTTWHTKHDVTVPDRRCRILLKVVLVGRWVIWVLGIWSGEGLGKGLRKGSSVYKQLETEVEGSCHS